MRRSRQNSLPHPGRLPSIVTEGLGVRNLNPSVSSRSPSPLPAIPPWSRQPIDDVCHDEENEDQELRRYFESVDFTCQLVLNRLQTLVQSHGGSHGSFGC